MSIWNSIWKFFGKWTANNDDSDDDSAYLTAKEELNQPNCRATFPKRGPTRAEFKKLVESKTQSVLKNETKDRGTDKKKKTNTIQTRITESVETITSHFCLVENTDERHGRSVRLGSASTTVYIGAGLISGTGTLPQVGSAGELKNAYHTHQKTLFQKLKDKLNKNTTCDDRGYLMVGDRRFSTMEFCNTLDEVGRKYYKAYLSSRREAKACQRMRHDIEVVFEHCKYILLRRILVDHLVDNDLLSPDGYKQWSEHVWVVASFATLIVILETIVKSLPHYNGTLMPKQV